MKKLLFDGRQDRNENAVKCLIKSSLGLIIGGFLGSFFGSFVLKRPNIPGSPTIITRNLPILSRKKAEFKNSKTESGSVYLDIISSLIFIK